MGPQHLNALKHLLPSLKGSSGYGIVYSHDGGVLIGCESKVTPDADSIVGYTASDYAMDPVTHHSMSGAVFLLAGGPISWSSKLQSSVSRSSTEAAKEAIWLRRLIHDLKQDITPGT